MPNPRFSGGSVSIRISSSQMLPPDRGSSPAMQLSAVDLPQPDGPSRQMNSPRRMVSVSSLSAAKACPPAPAKRRVTRSSLSSWKSCFMSCSSFPRKREPSGLGAATPLDPRLRRDEVIGYARSLRFLRAYLLVPDAERFHLGRRRQRLRVRKLLEPAFILGAAKLLDRVLALLRRHRQR